MSSLVANDILDELLDENNRILNELLFANNYVIKSLEFKELVDSIAKQFVGYLNPNVKKKYEELSRGLNRLIDQKWANISDESLNGPKIVNVTKLETSDHPIEPNSNCHNTNRDNVTDEEAYISEEELVKELNDSIAETRNNRPKHICNRCGNTYDFHEMLELHVLFCGPEPQSVSSESQPEYNSNDIEEEKEKEMVSEELVCENIVTIDNQNNYQGSGNREALVEEPMTDKLSVTTENISHKPMTRSSAKALSGQQQTQSSGGLNLSSKPSAKQKSKPNSRGKKKLFLYKCGFNGCNAVFRKRKAMTTHKKKLHQWKCDFPGCDFQTQCRNKIKQHMIRHSDVRSFECDHCDKKYKHKADLRRHMKLKHLDHCPNDPILICDRNQYRTESLNDRPFQCDHCYKNYKYKRGLREHIKKQHSVLLFDWNKCHYRTKSLEHLNVHKRIHTLPFECQICGQRFSAKINLKTHLNFKHQIK